MKRRTSRHRRRHVRHHDEGEILAEGTSIESRWSALVHVMSVAAAVERGRNVSWLS